jgi:hypothetical protein
MIRKLNQKIERPRKIRNRMHTSDEGYDDPIIENGGPYLKKSQVIAMVVPPRDLVLN